MQAFAENVWIIDGPSVRDMGLMFTTRMTVVKLSDELPLERQLCPLYGLQTTLASGVSHLQCPQKPHHNLP